MAESECLCDRCTALCCRYFALEIDTPETPEQFDDLRWYLAHEHVHIFVEDNDWYLAVQTKCQYLQPDHRCGIYEDRPKICREYTTDNCDYHTGQYDFQQYFTAPEQLEAFAQAALGDEQARYGHKQRLKNTGKKRGDADAPSKQEVRRGRMSPRIKAHPSARQPRTVTPPDAAIKGAMISLSVSVPPKR